MAIAGDTLEIEWQFDALDLRPAERWLATLTSTPRSFPTVGPLSAQLRPTSLHEDAYFDTEDWRIARSGYVLRLRRTQNRQEVTLKARSAPVASSEPKRRRELSQPLTTAPSRWLAEGGEVASRVAALVGRRPIHQVLEIRTRRRPFVLTVGDEEVAEVALDETVIAVGEQNPMRLLRVEVEVPPPWADALGPVVEDLRRSAGLTPAALSKFEAGALALGYTIPSGIDLGPTSVQRGATIGELADAVLRRQLAALLGHEPGTRLGDDPEELHDMRVATRRLRAALTLFADALPTQLVSLATELAWLAGLLGAVRDLDVQIARLSEPGVLAGQLAAQLPGSPLEELGTVLRREREEARVALLQALDSPRYERLTTGLVALVQQGAGRHSATGHLAATAVVPELIARRHRAATKAAKRARRSGLPADFHRLRIRCKRLRYAVEFVEDLYGEAATAFARRLARLQDLLGSIQDGQVAVVRFRSLATTTQPPLSRALVFLLGALAERADIEAAGLLAEARRKVKVLRGDEWQRLARCFETPQDATMAAGHERHPSTQRHPTSPLRALPTARALPPPRSAQGESPADPAPGRP